MDKGAAVAATVVAGGLVALQPPVNAMLAKSVGTFAASTVNFAVGTVLLILLTLTVGGGFGDLGEIRNVKWEYLMGGVLGVAYVTTVLVTVSTLGAGGVTAATIGGQLTASVVVDRLGLLGLEEKPLTAGRLIGIGLLALGVFLIVRE